jgi:hypothetical protein
MLPSINRSSRIRSIFTLSQQKLGSKLLKKEWIFPTCSFETNSKVYSKLKFNNLLHVPNRSFRPTMLMTSRSFGTVAYPLRSKSKNHVSITEIQQYVPWKNPFLLWSNPSINFKILKRRRLFECPVEWWNGGSVLLFMVKRQLRMFDLFTSSNTTTTIRHFEGCDLFNLFIFIYIYFKQIKFDLIELYL